MPAYTAICYEIDESPGDVFWVEHPIEARRRMANEHQDGELSGIQVNREPLLDDYEGKSIPMVVMMQLGWWTECMECGEKLSWDNLEDYGKDPMEVRGDWQGWCYCDENCERSHRTREGEKSALKRMFYDYIETYIRAKYGDDLTFYPERFNFFVQKNYRGDTYVFRSVSFHFGFPGQEHGSCTLRMDEEAVASVQHPPDLIPLLRTYVPHGDQVAFRDFHFARTGIMLDIPDRAA